MKLNHLFLMWVHIFLIASMAQAAAEMETYVSDRQAYIWKTPGYTWRDCRPADPQVYTRDKYTSDAEYQDTQARYASGGKEACDQRNHKTDLIGAGDRLTVLTDASGNPITAKNPKTGKDVFNLLIRGELVDIQFYKVRSEDGVEGWVSSGQVNVPTKKEIKKAKTEDPCPPSDVLGRLKESARNILRKANLDNGLGASKSETEMNRYACIYRHGHVSMDDFLDQIKKYQKAARDSSQAFGIPYPMLICTMLTESRMFYNPHENKKYKGLTQFGPELVADLKDLIRRSPYSEMWAKYQSKNPDVKFTDQAIRSSPDPQAPMAATALALRWIYQERMRDKGVNCKDCSTDGKFNRKDLYMMVTGYNWGPYSLKKVGHKSPDQMRLQFPPPEESRNYMGFMESCMESGYEKTFRELPRDIVKVNSRREARIEYIENKLSANKRHASLPAASIESYQTEAQNLRLYMKAGVGFEYEKNVRDCDKHFPVK